MNYHDEIWNIADKLLDVKAEMFREYKATKDDRLYGVSQLLWDAADSLMNIALLLQTLHIK